MAQWNKTKYPGIVYREHPTRRHGVRLDRYYVIRYSRGGKQQIEALGWASNGVKLERVSEILSEIRQSIRTGEGPQSVKERRELLEKVREQERQAEEKARLHTFAAVAAVYVEEYSKPNKSSWKNDRTRLNKHVKPVFGDVPIQQVTPHHLETLKTRCAAKGLAPATVKQCLAVARAVINYATMRGWFEGLNPIKMVKMPKVDNQRLRHLTRDEERRFFKYAATYSKDVHDKCLLALDLGLRMSEIHALERMDVNFNDSILYIRDPKALTRTAHMSPRVAIMFQHRVPTCPQASSPLFPGPDGEKRKWGMESQFKTIIRHLGFNDGIDDDRLKIVPHTFRHTFASRLIAQGTPIPVVKEMMGHATLEMTMRYVHVDEGQRREAAKKLHG